MREDRSMCVTVELCVTETNPPRGVVCHRSADGLGAPVRRARGSLRSPTASYAGTWVFLRLQLLPEFS